MVEPSQPSPQPNSGRRGREEHPDDRAMDRLADRGPSRVGTGGAMRARDVSRPTADDMADAEANLIIRRARPVP